MVGTADGVVVLPEWVAPTAGMEADQWAYLRGRIEGVPGSCRVWRVSLADLAPYLLPEPVPTVPRAAVQAAVKRIRAKATEYHLSWERDAIDECADIIEEEVL